MISNIPLWSVGSSRELYTEKKTLNYNNFKADLLTCKYVLFLYRAKNLHSYSCRMISVYTKVGENPSKKNPRKLEGDLGEVWGIKNCWIMIIILFLYVAQVL